MLKQAIFAFVVVTAGAAETLAAQPASDTEIRQAIIAQSIASYRGPCPCPYNTARNGTRCGARSAYSRPGGASPVCFPQDVSQAMLDEYRRQHPTLSR